MQNRQVNFVKNLESDLRLLTSSADEQVKWLKKEEKFWLPVDELALEFNERFILVDSEKEKCGLSDDLVKCLNRLDESLTKMSGEHNAELWTYEALAQSQEWADVRVLASQCINLLPKLQNY